ncbi:MFS general substrate transporter [Umbelopsis sp. PMI_123]|nr:MFS general substrate transporter [Umbelopsis sp. PMI_123]
MDNNDLKNTESGGVTTTHYEGRQPDWSPEAERALVRKIDFRILPMLIIMYILNYVDRTNIGNAKIAGLLTDLNMDAGVQYNWALSIFFFGYLLLEIPSNLILAYTRPSLYIPAIMMCWAVISALTGLVQSYSGLLAVRFFLGIVEAGFFPGCLFLLSSWYKKHELAKRMSILYCGSIVSGAFGGLMAYGIIQGLEGARGIAGWRWLFIIEGSITVFAAIIAVFILPDYPTTTRWLSKEEIRIAETRLVLDGHEPAQGKAEFTFRHVGMALKDWRVYFFVFLFMLDVCAGTISYFIPTIVANLGYSSAQAQLMTAPPYVFAAILALFNGWHADRTQERGYHVATPMLMAMVGFIISAATMNLAARYFALFLCAGGIWSTIAIILAWTGNTLNFPKEKRAVSLALVNMIGNLSSVYGAQLYPASNGPRYVPGNVANATFCFAGAVLAVLMKHYILPRYNGPFAERPPLEDEPDKPNQISSADADPQIVQAGDQKQ